MDVIVFVDLTEALVNYGEDRPDPRCAFLETVTDRFVENDVHCHVFNMVEDVPPHLRERIPEGFFK